MGMKKVQKKQILWLTSTASIALVLGLIGAHLASDSHSRHLQIETRAKRVFAFDADHRNEIPSHLLRQLSVALEFHDDDGAMQLLNELESKAGL